MTTILAWAVCLLVIFGLLWAAQHKPRRRDMPGDLRKRVRR